MICDPTEELPPELPGFRLTDLVYRSPRSRVWKGVNAESQSVMVKFPADDYPSERQLAGMHRALKLGQLLQGEYVVPHLSLEVHGQKLALVTEDYGAQSLDHLQFYMHQ